MGPALDKTDGVTEEVALSPTVNLSKNGGVYAARNSATAIAHDADGHYRVELNATDTNTLGRLRAYFQDPATHLPVWEDFMVVPANVYDSLIAGSDTLKADVTQLVGVAQSATDLKDFADAGYDPATNKVQGVVLVDTTTTNTDMRGTDGANTTVPLAAASTATLANQTTILNRIGDFAGTGLNTIKGFFQAMFRKDGGVSGANLPSEINEVENTISGTYDASTDSQEATRDTAPLGTAMRGTDGANTITPPTSAAIADAVHDEALSGHTTAGTAGKKLSDIPTTAMRGTDGANTTTPPTVTAIRTEMDNNSAKLAEVTAARKSELDAGTSGKMANDVDTRLPTSSELAYIVDHAKTAPPVTFTGGSTTTAILGNVDGVAASSTDDFYNGAVLIFNAGTLDEQRTDITDYVGATKTATITAVTTAVTSSHTAIMV
ncbi:MAG: hypothetical protein ACE5IR_22865 [bacterium]